MSTRRAFLRNSALAVLGGAALPSFLTRAAIGAAHHPELRAKRLVVILQRGAADGLNIVVPHGEPLYYALRPTINIPSKSVLDLDGFFGLHPAMASLLALWTEKRLAIVHAAGFPGGTRSHFEAQDFMESGTPGVTAREDGWLNRALQEHAAAKPALRAIGLGHTLPLILSGKKPEAAAHGHTRPVGGKDPKAAGATSFKAE
jgi:uncharacterized protein (DUF1501 family)